MAYIYNKNLVVDSAGNVSLTLSPTAGDNTTKVATTAFVTAAIAAKAFNGANVAITGGSINGTTVGATTRSTGSFTTGNFSSTLTATAVNVSGLLTLSGAVVETTRVVTAAGNVTVNATDVIIVVNKTVGAPTTVTLPTTPAVGRFISVKDGRGDGATNNLTIVPAAGTIDGSANVVINIPYGSADLVYNGTNWSVLAGPA